MRVRRGKWKKGYVDRGKESKGETEMMMRNVYVEREKKKEESERMR